MIEYPPRRSRGQKGHTMKKKKNLSLAYCIRVIRPIDPEFAQYISQYTEKQLNMEEVSAYVRDRRDNG